MQFRGFTVSCSLVIKFHKTGNNVLNSTVIEIFHGKGNCLGTNAGPYGKSRTGFVNWYLLISCHNQFYCFSFNPFLLSTLKRIRKKIYIINIISQGRLLPRNLRLAGFTILPCASKQEEDYYLVFSSYNFIDIKKNESHGLRMSKVEPKFFKFVVFNPSKSFSTLNHPCSWVVYYYLFGVFTTIFRFFFNLKVILHAVKITQIIVRCIFSSFPLAESPPRDRQIIAYK